MVPRVRLRATINLVDVEDEEPPKEEGFNLAKTLPVSSSPSSQAVSAGGGGGELGSPSVSESEISTSGVAGKLVSPT